MITNKISFGTTLFICQWKFIETNDKASNIYTVQYWEKAKLH